MGRSADVHFTRPSSSPQGSVPHTLPEQSPQAWVEGETSSKAEQPTEASSLAFDSLLAAAALTPNESSALRALVLLYPTLQSVLLQDPQLLRLLQQQKGSEPGREGDNSHDFTGGNSLPSLQHRGHLPRTWGHATSPGQPGAAAGQGTARSGWRLGSETQPPFPQLLSMPVFWAITQTSLLWPVTVLASNSQEL